MARQSLSVLVLLVLCRYAHAQDAPFRIVQDPVAFERVAVRTGLTAVQAEEVLRTLAVPKEAPPQGIGHAFAEWRARGIDVIPYLLSLLEKDSVERTGLGISQVFLDQNISLWLAMTDDSRAHRAVIDETKRMLAEKW